MNVRVPTSLLSQIDEVWEERGYANKSEFIRDALRDAVNPPHATLRGSAGASGREPRTARAGRDGVAGRCEGSAGHR
ncbi:ribbon-helix-helix domain-containing protein [Halanaeroarchaeum sp. HSR-CO]|uniref:ribbon-helix-helix domain-containing protein n=1 Tax=Halanaeroarchaeum sp. HSR-CO TaxID=2866382 RepID=UPI002877AEA2|nr:ribbon-helix-helix domain-containing protein [Halanaeroarchaeum sp. HSR-CO]